MKPHWREDLQQEFDRQLVEAEEAGYKVENYIPTGNELFGDYIKESQKHYAKAHKWSR